LIVRNPNDCVVDKNRKQRAEMRVVSCTAIHLLVTKKKEYEDAESDEGKEAKCIENEFPDSWVLGVVEGGRKGSTCFSETCFFFGIGSSLRTATSHRLKVVEAGRAKIKTLTPAGNL
jgi:hypothetical protein